MTAPDLIGPPLRQLPAEPPIRLSLVGCGVYLLLATVLLRVHGLGQLMLVPAYTAAALVFAARIGLTFPLLRLAGWLTLSPAAVSDLLTMLGAGGLLLSLNVSRLPAVPGGSQLLDLTSFLVGALLLLIGVVRTAVRAR